MKPLAACFLLLVMCCRVFAQPIPGFGPPDDKKPIVGFGLKAEILLNIEAAHWEHTIGYMKRMDKDLSGYLERDELKHFNDVQFREADLNGDGRFSFYEKALEDLAARERGAIGRRKRSEVRLIDGQQVTANDRQQAADTIKKYDKNGNGVIEDSEIPMDWRISIPPRLDANGDRRITLREMERRWGEYRQERARRHEWWTNLAPEGRKESNRTWELSAAIIRKYDRDKNNALGPIEWRNVPGDVSSADKNGNGFIVVMELSDWMLEKLHGQSGTIELKPGVPEWFIEKDDNFDGQVTLREYTTSLKPSIVAAFRRHDRNGDGIITEAECRESITAKDRYTNDRERVMEPRLGVVSDIVVAEDIVIADIDVQFAARHNGPEQFSAILTSPSGQSVELFNGKGKRWRGSDFMDTILDDEAPTSITNANPPFEGIFQPDGVGQRKTSLSAFYGKPARGTWRLELRTSTSPQPGVFHGWSLLIERRR